MKKQTLLIGALVLVLGVAATASYFVSDNGALQGRFGSFGPPPCDPEKEDCEEMKDMLPPLEECDPIVEDCEEKLPPLPFEECDPVIEECSDMLPPLEDCDPAKEECMEPDYDKDGLSDKEEMDLGTDGKNPDTDGDGLSDGAEVHIEYTNPNDADTDSGGVDDGKEVLD